MQTVMQTIDTRISQIPNWLMGMIFGGLVYSLLVLTLFLLPFFVSGPDYLFWLVMSFKYMGWFVGSKFGLPSVIAGIVPFLIAGGLIGATNSKTVWILIVIALVMLVLAPIVYITYFILLSFTY